MLKLLSLVFVSVICVVTAHGIKRNVSIDTFFSQLITFFRMELAHSFDFDSTFFLYVKLAVFFSSNIYRVECMFRTYLMLLL